MVLIIENYRTERCVVTDNFQLSVPNPEFPFTQILG